MSSKLAFAVATVLIRGLFDRVLDVVNPCCVAPGLPPQALFVPGAIVVSGLYSYWSRNRKDPAVCRQPRPERESKILDGRIHKERSSDHRCCEYHSRSRRSRSKSRDSVQTLHQVPSTYSVSTKTEGSTYTPCAKDSSIPETSKESVTTVKSDDEEKPEDEGPVDESASRYHGYGDCKWDQRHSSSIRRRRRHIYSKTRSGKVYSAP